MPGTFDASAAHAQWDEFVGTIAIDDLSHLDALLTRAGIDPAAWHVLGLKIFLIGHGNAVAARGPFSGDLRFYVVDRSELKEVGNISKLVDQGRIPVKEIRVQDPDGSIVQEALFPSVKGTVIEVVSGRVHNEGWQLQVEGEDGVILTFPK